MRHINQCFSPVIFSRRRRRRRRRRASQLLWSRARALTDEAAAARALSRTQRNGSSESESERGIGRSYGASGAAAALTTPTTGNAGPVEARSRRTGARSHRRRMIPLNDETHSSSLLVAGG